MQQRGQLTQRIKDRSKELLGYEVSTCELRLLPYILYTMVNNQCISSIKINAEERAVLSKWRNEGHITGGTSKMGITREFYDIASELVFLGYVDLFD